MPEHPDAAAAISTPSPSPTTERPRDPVVSGLRRPAIEGRRDTPARPLPPAAASAGPSSKSAIYLTPEGKHLGHEFRNIMLLALSMSLVIVVLSFFLR